MQILLSNSWKTITDLGSYSSVDQICLFSKLKHIMKGRSRNLFLLNRPESDAVLKCVVRGYPPPTVEWFRLPRRRGVRREKMIQLEQGRV